MYREMWVTDEVCWWWPDPDEPVGEPRDVSHWPSLGWIDDDDPGLAFRAPWLLAAGGPWEDRPARRALRRLIDYLLAAPERIHRRGAGPGPHYLCPAPGDALEGHACSRVLPCAEHSVPDWQTGWHLFGASFLAPGRTR